MPPKFPSPSWSSFIVLSLANCGLIQILLTHTQSYLKNSNHSLLLVKNHILSHTHIFDHFICKIFLDPNSMSTSFSSISSSPPILLLSALFFFTNVTLHQSYHPFHFPSSSSHPFSVLCRYFNWQLVLSCISSQFFVCRTFCFHSQHHAQTSSSSSLYSFAQTYLTISSTQILQKWLIDYTVSFLINWRVPYNSGPMNFSEKWRKRSRNKNDRKAPVITIYIKRK